MEAALISWVVTFVAPVIVNAPSAVPAPRLALNSMFPVPNMKVAGKAPSIVPLMMISPPPALVSTISGATRMTSCAVEMFPVKLVKDPPRKPIPVADWVIDPEITVGAVGVPELVPVVERVRGPKLEVVTDPLLTKFTPVKTIPATPFVLRSPLKVNVPGVQVKSIEVASVSWMPILAAELITVAPSRVVAPAAPVQVIFPVPASKVKFPGPSTVLEKTIGLPAVSVVINVELSKVTGPAKETVSAAV